MIISVYYFACTISIVAFFTWLCWGPRTERKVSEDVLNAGAALDKGVYKHYLGDFFGKSYNLKAYRYSIFTNGSGSIRYINCSRTGLPIKLDHFDKIYLQKKVRKYFVDL
jgi:hypothetical protein